jgi:hypothetical protein
MKVIALRHIQDEYERTDGEKDQHDNEKDILKRAVLEESRDQEARMPAMAATPKNSANFVQKLKVQPGTRVMIAVSKFMPRRENALKYELIPGFSGSCLTMTIFLVREF